jgi:putative PEP-CTERM system TPR-repeat lipoprotein
MFRSSETIRVLAAASLMLLYGASVACNNSPQAREAKYLRRGADFLAKKDYVRALLEFKNASAAMPKDAEPYYQMGITYFADGNVAGGAANLRKAVALNPKHQLAQLKLDELGAMSPKKDEVQKVADRLEALLAASPDNTEATDALAFAEWRLGKTDEAVARLEETLKKSPARLQTSMELARLKVAKNDVPAAEEILQKAVAADPKSSAAELALGQIYMLANQPAKAEVELRKAIQLDSKSGAAMMGLAAIQVAGNRMEEAEETYRQASQVPGPTLKPVHALFLFRNGKRDAALAEFEKLAKQDPNDRAARTRLFTAYVQMGKNQPAQDLLAAALKKNPKDTEALFQRASLWLRSGNVAEAEKDIREVLRYTPDLAQGHAAMAQVDTAKGLNLAARTELNEALRLNKALLPARLELARNLTRDKEAKSALDLLNKTPDNQKAMLGVVIERNWALYAAGEMKEMRASLDRALKVRRFPELVVQDAVARLQERDYPGVIADAEEVIKNNPEDVRGLRLLADGYLSQNQPAKAEQRLKALVAEHPKSAPLANFLGVWYVNARNLPAARQAFEAALAIEPKYLDSSIALADLDTQEKHPDAARQRLQPLLAANPANIKILNRLAGTAIDAGDNEEAMRHYRSVLAIDGSNLMALNNLAYILAPSQPDEALKFAQHAAELAPDNASIADTLGWVYYRKSVYGMAATYLETAVKRESTPRREFHLAMCYLKTGRRDLSAKYMQMALKQDPNLPATEKGW